MSSSKNSASFESSNFTDFHSKKTWCVLHSDYLLDAKSSKNSLNNILHLFTSGDT